MFFLKNVCCFALGFCTVFTLVDNISATSFPTQPFSTIDLGTPDIPHNLSGIPTNVHNETSDSNSKEQSVFSSNEQPFAGLSLGADFKTTNNGKDSGQNASFDDKQNDAPHNSLFIHGKQDTPYATLFLDVNVLQQLSALSEPTEENNPDPNKDESNIASSNLSNIGNPSIPENNSATPTVTESNKNK